MAEQDFDLNTQETLEKLGCSRTKLTRLVDEGTLSRVPKNPGSDKGRGSGWLYSSQQIDAYLYLKKCSGDCKQISKATLPISATRTTSQLTAKRQWWKIWR